MPDPGSASKARPWGDLRLRVLSALVLLPVGLGCLWAGDWAWAVLIGAVSVGMAFEWATLCAAPAALVALAAPVAAATAFTAWGLAGPGLLVVAAGTALVWWRSRGIWLSAGLPYIGLTAVALVWLRDATGTGRDNVLLVLLVVWATDIFAYVAGRLLGGPRLAPSISPGKTWSGAAGGLAGAVLVGWIAATLLGGALPAVQVLAFAAVLSVVAQAGDLMESAIKRHFGAKDSGKLIPGHGGLLDRLDGVLTAAPLAALLALVAGPGVGFWQ